MLPVPGGSLRSILMCLLKDGDGAVLTQLWRDPLLRACPLKSDSASCLVKIPSDGILAAQHVACNRNTGLGISRYTHPGLVSRNNHRGRDPKIVVALPIFKCLVKCDLQLLRVRQIDETLAPWQVFGNRATRWRGEHAFEN
jgi:hypothetical protein